MRSSTPMLKLTVRNVRARKRRLVSTFLAVAIGVAFLSGTLVLTDTVRRTFDNLFADVYKGTDAFVRSSTKIESDSGDTRGRVSTDLVPVIQGVDGVQAVE